jgi:hypothetical protein
LDGILEIPERNLSPAQCIEPGSRYRGVLELHSVKSEPVFFTHCNR